MGSDFILRVEKELDRIFASLGHGMYVVDSDRVILLWNKAAESILGWTEEEALGRSCRDIIEHLGDDGRCLCDASCPLTASMDGSHSLFAGTVWAHAKDGTTVPVNVSCSPLINEDGRLAGAVEVFSDMTHEKEVEDYKNSMVSVVAHELRTPLTSMKGYLELVTEGEAGEVTDDQLEFLGIVESNVARLEDLVSDLLDVGRLESGRLVMHWESLDLEFMVREAIATYAPLAGERGLSIDCLVEQAPPVQGDSQLFGRVISNLVSNALKYTNEGGVTVRIRPEGDGTALVVEDTGVGIPPGEQANVLEKFFRASTASETGATGSGLGLAIVGDIVEKHGARLELTSDVGKGSVFKVFLPAAREPMILEQEGSGGE